MDNDLSFYSLLLLGVIIPERLENHTKINIQYIVQDYQSKHLTIIVIIKK